MDRAWLLVLSLTSASIGSLGLLACDSGAVGVDSCRQIEYARCNAAFDCPGTFKVTSPAACRRFYRDHCLHGLEIPQDPGPSVVNPCVNAIEAIHKCLVDKGEYATLEDCSISKLGIYSTQTTACGLLGDLGNITGCTFLNPVTPVIVSDAGSDAGS